MLIMIEGVIISLENRLRIIYSCLKTRSYRGHRNYKNRSQLAFAKQNIWR